MYGLVIIYANAAIFHVTKKLGLVVDSSMEAEGIATSKIAEQISCTCARYFELSGYHPPSPWKSRVSGPLGRHGVLVRAGFGRNNMLCYVMLSCMAGRFVCLTRGLRRTTYQSKMAPEGRGPSPWLGASPVILGNRRYAGAVQAGSRTRLSQAAAETVGEELHLRADGV